MNTFHNEAAAALTDLTLGQQVSLPAMKITGTLIAIEAGDWSRVRLTESRVRRLRTSMLIPA